MKKVTGIFLIVCALTVIASAQLKILGLPVLNKPTNLLKPVQESLNLVTGTISSLAKLFLKPFQDFQVKFNKKYDSPEEEAKRLEIFAQNAKLIEDSTKKHKINFIYKVNEFCDLMASEFLKYLGGLRYRRHRKIHRTTTTTTLPPPVISTAKEQLTTTTTTTSTTTTTTTTSQPTTSTTTTTTTKPTTTTTTPVPTTSTTTPVPTTTTTTPVSTTSTTTPVPTTTTTTPLPTTTQQALIDENNLDWRRLNCMSEIRYQAQCAASFAFATAAAIEVHLCRKTGRHYVISPQNLIDCTITTPYENSGCDGGALEPTYDYMVDVGLNTEEDYQYEGLVSKCKFKKEKSVGKIQDYISIDEGNEKAMKFVLHKYGPITVGIDATHDSFRFYGGGIYYEPKCKTAIEYLNHAVLLVGYGEENGEKYWIIRNSYGTSWGEEGYARISRNVSNHCGIATYAVYPIV